MSDNKINIKLMSNYSTSREHTLPADVLSMFKESCSSIITSLPSEYPSGIQLNGTWKLIHQHSLKSSNPKTGSQEMFTTTLYGKRSSHGGQSTRGGFRDPITPTTARVQVPIPNPSITTLMSYVERCMEGQIEEGASRDWLRTKKFQVDTHLTVYFEWVKEEGEKGGE
ncbi:hypothetical protein GRF29_77g90378 [Pseudopithomyces chartarum]|uniref:Uncharacterized protein n=1 Tax=Pseudopithomyces chartarum TaxID=1892770 RepID=A0AAN6LVJ3_9PLEO|nr:hypothetical protein GRF29_77g90378 [Pseudopithomyces chartarum]